MVLIASKVESDNQTMMLIYNYNKLIGTLNSPLVN